MVKAILVFETMPESCVKCPLVVEWPPCIRCPEDICDEDQYYCRFIDDDLEFPDKERSKACPLQLVEIRRLTEDETNHF